MNHVVLWRFTTLLLLVGFASTAWGQQRPSPRTVRQMQQRMQQRMKEVAENQPQLPSDPQLLGLHREFISKAEKLAAEYERKKQYGQAREVYESLVRLVPKYGAAEAGLKRMLNQQSQQDKKVTKVSASQGWQDSGATLREGMPVHFEIKGDWRVIPEDGARRCRDTGRDSSSRPSDQTRNPDRSDRHLTAGTRRGQAVPRPQWGRLHRAQEWPPVHADV